MIAYWLVYVAGKSPRRQVGGPFRRPTALGHRHAGGRRASALMVVTVGWAGLLPVVVYLVWRAASHAMFIAPK